MTTSVPPTHSLPPGLVLGTRADDASAGVVALTAAELATHKLCLGVSGMGKSVLLASYCLQLLNRDIPFVLIDPHSDTARLVVQLAADSGYFTDPAAFDRLWYLDFAHPHRRVPLNVLAGTGPPFAVAEQVMEAIRRAFPTGEFAALLETIGGYALATLAHTRRPLTDLVPLLTQPDLRAQLVQVVPDPQVQAFWGRFAGWGKGLTIESTARRFDLLTMNPHLRGSLGQVENRMDAGALLARGTSVLCDLGGLDGRSQRLVACLLTVAFETAAMARRALPPTARRPYHLVIDEWSHVAPGSEEAVIHLLDRARKFGVFLVAAMQHTGHLGGLLAGALDNCALIALRLGEADAQWAAPRFTRYDPTLVKYPATTAHGRPTYVSRGEQRERTADTLSRLPPRHGLLRVGARVAAFRTLGLPPARADISPLLDRYADLLLRAPPPGANVAPDTGTAGTTVLCEPLSAPVGEHLGRPFDDDERTVSSPAAPVAPPSPRSRAHPQPGHAAVNAPPGGWQFFEPAAPSAAARPFGDAGDGA